MSDAIFNSTSQALHVSFLVVSVDPKRGNSLRQALIRIIESVELPSARLKAWLSQLRGEPSGTVNFAGLDPFEIRGQCAMLTQAARDHLFGPERAAVIASYTRDDIEMATAVQYLSNYIQPEADSRTRLLYDYCVLRCLPKHEKKKSRLIHIYNGFGVNDKSVAAHVREVRKKFSVYRARGEANIDAFFKKHGVVDEES